MEVKERETGEVIIPNRCCAKTNCQVLAAVNNTKFFLTQAHLGNNFSSYSFILMVGLESHVVR
jgi:hypothetical protein